MVLLTEPTAVLTAVLPLMHRRPIPTPGCELQEQEMNFTLIAAVMGRLGMKVLSGWQISG